MIPEELKKAIVENYKLLCRKYKIQNWQKQVSFENFTELLYKMDKKIDNLEKELKNKG